MMSPPSPSCRGGKRGELDKICPFAVDWHTEVPDSNPNSSSPIQACKIFLKLLFTLTFNQELKPSYLPAFQFVIIACNNQGVRQVNHTSSVDCVLLKRADHLGVQTLMNCLIWSQVCESSAKTRKWLETHKFSKEKSRLREYRAG